MTNIAATTILIADQQRMIRKSFIKILNEIENIEIIGEVDNGAGILKILQQGKINLLLVDIYMPDMQGLQIIKIICNNHPETRMIVVSMLKEKLIIDRLIGWGVQGFVSKNSTPEDLIKAVDAVIAGNKYFCNEFKRFLSNKPQEPKWQKKSDLLSKREKEIIFLIEKGGTSRSISAELFLSVKTIECHRSNIYKKLNVKNVAELIRLMNSELLST